MMEIEIPVSESRVFSRIKRNGNYALKLETVLFAIYYPAALGSGEGMDPSGRTNWSRPVCRTRLLTIILLHFFIINLNTNISLSGSKQEK